MKPVNIHGALIKRSYEIMMRQEEKFIPIGIDDLMISIDCELEEITITEMSTGDILDRDHFQS